MAVTVATIGFHSGIQEPPKEPPLSQAALTESSGAQVPSYAMLGEVRRGPNANLYKGAFEALGDRLPKVMDEVRREGTIVDVLRARATRRAFDGAPPTIPHEIDQRGYPACLACHEHGAAVGNHIAPAMSHEPFASCIQCHVPEKNPVDLGTTVVENQFVGLAAPALGSRAWKGAPPTIPHTTAMRERCSSCHGVSGSSAIRTTHPWRQSCPQCHVPATTNYPAAFPAIPPTGDIQ